MPEAIYIKIFKKILLAGNLNLRVLRTLAAPSAKLYKLYLARDHLLVLAGIVITTLADAAAQSDQFVSIFGLCHSRITITKSV